MDKSAIKSVRSKNGELLFLHGNLRGDSTQFFTEIQDLLQIGYIVFKKNYKVQAHRHRMRQGTHGYAEVLYVLEGKVKYEIFDYRNISKSVSSGVAMEGDVLFIGRVSHRFVALGNVRLLEIKQGPYPQEGDKEILQ